MKEHDLSAGDQGANQGRPIDIGNQLAEYCDDAFSRWNSPTSVHDMLSRINRDISREGDAASRDDAYKIIWAYRVLALSEIDWEYTLLNLPQGNRLDWKNPLPYVYQQFREDQRQQEESGDYLFLSHNQAGVLSYAIERAQLPIKIDIPPKDEQLYLALHPLIQAAESAGYVQQSSGRPMNFLTELTTYEEERPQQWSLPDELVSLWKRVPGEESDSLEALSVTIEAVKNRIDRDGDEESRDTAYKVFWAFQALVIPYIIFTDPRTQEPLARKDWPYPYFRDEFRMEQERRSESGDEISLNMDQARVLSSLLARMHLSISVAPPIGENIQISMQPLLEAAEQTKLARGAGEEGGQRNNTVNSLLTSVFPDGLPGDEELPNE